MKKKIAKKKSARRSSRTPKYVSIQYFLIGFSVVAVFFTALVVDKLTSSQRVLGASTYLADNGGSGGGTDDSVSGSGDSSPTNSFVPPTFDSGNQNSGGSSPVQPTGTQTNTPDLERPTGIEQGSVSSQTTVDCVGPDGKHFTTTFELCKHLNTAYHRESFHFTVLSQTQTVRQHTERTNAGQPPQVTPALAFPSSTFVKTIDKHQSIDLTQKNTETEIQTDGNHISVKTKTSDGSEVELEGNDALNSLNEDLKDENIEISSTSAHEIEIHRGSVAAHTSLPISIDPTTKTLSVVTPAGTKELTILPDQAVQNLLDKGIITSVESQTTGVGTTSAQQTVELTDLNNQPVFQINGVSSKRLLGIIPVSFAKTSFVSTQDGSVVQTNESFLGKLLETFSF